MTYLLGCDPEVFVRNPNSLQFQCAHNMVPGTKSEPFKVPNGAVQVDGMALEFNINPASTQAEWLGNIKGVYHELSTMVRGFELVAQPSAHFEQSVFDTAPDVAKLLGCDPDYNAYTGLKNSPPQGDKPFRTAAGHVHIGWTDGVDPFEPVHFADCIEVVKQLDYALGLQSLEYDPDNERRLLYGRAGAFRPKPYGVEYRVLSNAWLQSDELINWVWTATQEALTLLERGTSLHRRYGSAAQTYINKGVSGHGKYYAEGITNPPKCQMYPIMRAA